MNYHFVYFRQLLNRVIHMKLSAKKMKFFFKKFLDFEKSHGDDKHIEYVKKKAFEYVESKGFVDEWKKNIWVCEYVELEGFVNE